MARPTVGQPALAELDLVIVAGATFGCRIEYSREEDGAEAPVDMAGWGCRMTLRGTDGKVVDASACVDLSDGAADIGMPPSRTASLPPGPYWWELVLRDGDGDVYRLAAGQARVHAMAGGAL